MIKKLLFYILVIPIVLLQVIIEEIIYPFIIEVFWDLEK